MLKTISKLICFFWISREKFEPESGFEPGISRSLAWRSYQLSYPSFFTTTLNSIFIKEILNINLKYSFIFGK